MKKRNLFKIAALTAVFALGSMFANAQQTTGNITVQDEVIMGNATGYVKVIDNKGTVKYLQSQNGITMFTNTAPSGGIVTTWQLGGQLTDNTYIDANGKEFGIKNLAVAGTGSYNLVVVDALTGEFRTLEFEDLITSGRQKFTIGATYPVPASDYICTLSPVVVLPDFAQVYVYRNGAKLLANEDYTLNGTGAFEITSTLITLYPGDIIEVHYVK